MIENNRNVLSEDDFVIKTPGKFEGCQRYVPHFWEVVLNGLADDADDNGDGSLEVSIDEGDVKRFPELEGYRAIRLEESEQGFVYSMLLI